MIIALQALKKRSNNLEKRSSALQQENEILKNTNGHLQKCLLNIEVTLSDIKNSNKQPAAIN